MSQSTYVCVQYQGKWIRSNNGWEWVGNLAKGLMVERGLKFEELIRMIYSKIGINENDYSIELKHKCPWDGSKNPPIHIGDDEELDDVFCLYAKDRSFDVYVELKPVKGKQTCLADNEDDDGGRDEREYVVGLDVVGDRVGTTNDTGNGSNSTPVVVTTFNEVGVETHNPVMEWNEHWNQVGNDTSDTQVIGFDSSRLAIGLNEGDGEEDEGRDFVEDESFHSQPQVRSESSANANRRRDGSDLCVGQEFESKSELNYKLNLVAIQGKFEMKILKSTPSLKVVKCVDDSCSWRLRAVKAKNSNFFHIRCYDGFHTCTMMNRSIHHKQATSRVIATRMQGHFQCTKTPPKPKMLVEFVRNELELQCTYWKAWKAKRLAQDLIRGTPEHNFAVLPCYCYMLKKVNRGTVTHIEVDEENRFKYFFMALGAQIRGFRFMRKVIGIDGAWIKTKFKGVLLVASSQDSEFHSYPIAWGLVDSENNASWTWFLEKLKEVIPDDPELCFISDRGPSILHSVKLVYPQVIFKCYLVTLIETLVT